MINLLWKENSDSHNREKRKTILKDLGVETKLKEMAKDKSDTELNSKVNQAIKSLNE